MSSVASQMDLTDRSLLNIVQSSFPLVEEPYRELGSRLEIPEAEVIERLKRLKNLHLLRQISAIFDTRRLGYKSTLVAMRYPPEQLDRSAKEINRHPGVSHNYARDGYFNLWFTLAVAPSESLEETIEEMARRTGAEAFRLLPTLRLFKIGVNFDMVQGNGTAHDHPRPDGQVAPQDAEVSRGEALTEFEIGAIRELQEDLSLIPRPFDDMSRRLNMATQELFGLADSFQRRGIMRRYSAVLHHQSAGFTANAMAVWRVPPERSEEVGRVMASSPWVTHCYQRPTFPDWPYSHFSMIHSTTQRQCEEIAREISRETGITDYTMVYSTHEYKKTRVRYF
ncbi:MAG: Lrp/AsnC family transcriptional regulator [Dehalococcoidia bacterium]|nr:Lrp/AsnC family transcriptional regulator [Dehalococcoidia bacterium]